VTVFGVLSFLDPLHWAKVLAGDALHLVVSWVQDGAKSAIGAVAHVIGATTTPQLTSTWFSTAYWRVAGVATLLTVPFLFAAALQAVIRSDMALLARAVFGYLPLALIGVGIAAPITMLLLSATDEMSNLVSGLAVGGASHFLTQAAEAFVLTGGSPFVAFLVAVITTAAAIALAIEMMIRAAAVYIIVLMLPMVFAALVWPARRIWAVRLVELLIALIVSKFVIVAVLSLAGAAYGQSGVDSVTRALTAMSLLLLSTFAPWTMLRLLPFTEIAASAAGAIRQELPARPRLPQGAGGGGDLGSSAQPTPVASNGSAAGAGDPLDLVATRLRTQAADAFGRQGAGSSQNGHAGGGGDPSSPAPGTDRSAAGADSEPGSPGMAEPAREERLPGMEPIWQAENGAWPPLNLGPGGWGGPTEYIPPADPPQSPAPPESPADPPAPPADPPAPPAPAPGPAGPGADTTPEQTTPRDQ